MHLKTISPCRLILGADKFTSFLPHFLARNTVLFITSPNMLKRDLFSSILKRNYIHTVFRTITANPEINEVEGISQSFTNVKIDKIIAVGGGSVIDSAKVLSVLLHDSNKKLKLDSILRTGQSFEQARLPLVCVPTTAGTGAEVTPFATIWDSEFLKKRSFSSHTLLPDLVILDPTLAVTAPYELTINCALDTCSHALESIWNRNATQKSIRLALNSLKFFIKYFPQLVQNLSSPFLRLQMQKSSFLGGLAISKTRTALAHSISYPLTLRYKVPHGLACSFTLERIAKEVNLQHAWPSSVNMNIISDALHIINTINPQQRILKYCSIDQIRDLQSEMLTEGRCDNFVLPPETTLSKILGS